MDHFWFLVFNCFWERLSSERWSGFAVHSRDPGFRGERRMDGSKAHCTAIANSDLLLYKLCIVLLKNVCIS